MKKLMAALIIVAVMLFTITPVVSAHDSGYCGHSTFVDGKYMDVFTGQYTKGHKHRKHFHEYDHYYKHGNQWEFQYSSVERCPRH